MQRAIRNLILARRLVPILASMSLVLALVQGARSHSSPLAQALSASSISGSAPSLVVAEPAMRLVSSGDSGIILELSTPGFEIEQGTWVGGTCDHLIVAGYGETDLPGSPRLPVRGAMVGIPPDVKVRLSVLEAEAVDLSGRFDLCPVGRPIVQAGSGQEIDYGGQEAVRDAVAYAGDRFYPLSPAEIVSIGLVRDQRVAQIRLNPFQYNPQSGQVRVYKRLLVTLEFGGNFARSQATAREGPFEAVLRDTLLNYETAREWRSSPPASSPMAAPDPYEGLAYKVLVDQDGIYRVTPADLESAGADSGSIDPRTLRLHNGGQEVPIRVTGEGDGSFDAGDHILFYGQKVSSAYTGTNVYWLTWGQDVGLRMANRDGTPGGAASVPTSFSTSLRVEKDLNYQAARPSGPEGDRWYWGWLWAASPISASFSTELWNVTGIAGTITVQGLFYGYDATPRHHTRTYLNGYLLDDSTWAPTVEYSFTVDVPQAYLVEGTNTFRVECPLDGGISADYVIVNRFDIEYRDGYVAEGDQLFFYGDTPGTWEYRITGFSTSVVEVYDITSPRNPIRIAGAAVTPAAGTNTLAFQQTIAAERHYLALTPSRLLEPVGIEQDTPSDLRSPLHGADYVAIAHGDFLDAIQPLAAHRAAQGLRTMVVDVQDVYDEFSYGLPDAQAIHDFLQSAYENWAPPAPTYVLLVGDGNYDPKDNLGRGEPSYIPPYLADADPWVGETAADNRFVCVSGDDFLPDMYLGRLPVKSAVEASTVVAKILAYETSPSGGDWNGRLLLVADNADYAGDFAQLADTTATELPESYSADKVYYNITHTTTASAKAAIIAAFNQGRLLVNYTGHGAIQFWAFEHLLDMADAEGLSNGGRLPFVVPMTCLEGYYITPSTSSFDASSVGESLVLAASGGAIASWSPTGMSLAAGHEYLNRGLFRALFANDVTQLGPATTKAKLYLYSHTAGYRELLDTYVLFGDPALRLNVLDAEVGIEKTVTPTTPVQPTDAVTFTLTVTNQGPATAHGVVITDLVPAFLADAQVVSSDLALAQRPGAPFAWDVADLAPGQVGTIVIRGTVDGAAGTGWFENRAQVAITSQESGALPNEAGASVLVVAGPPGQVHVSAIPAEIPAGGHRSTIRAQVLDTWGNIVADGTAVQFEASLGSLSPPAASTSAGIATSFLTSGQVSGMATVTVTAGTARGTVQVIFGAQAPLCIWLPLVQKGATR